MKKRTIAIITVLAMIITCFSAAPVMAKTTKSTTKPRLVKSVTTYDYYKKKYHKTSTTQYKYKNAYPTSITTTYTDGNEQNKTTFDYTFYKNGKPKKLIMSNTEGKPYLTKKYFTTGAVRQEFYDLDGIVWHEVFQYGVKNYLTIKVHEETRYNLYDDETGEELAEKTVDEYCDEIDYMTITKRKNGLLKRTRNRGIYANWTDEIEKKWYDFDGTYTAYYDKDGIIRLTSAVHRNMGYSGNESKFVVTKKDGKITRIVRYEWYSNLNKGKGAWVKAQKCVFTYYTTKIGKIRFSKMINDILMGENNYYTYKWY